MRCLHCGKAHDAPDQYEGKNVKCPFCGKNFTAKQYLPAPDVETVPTLPKLPSSGYLYFFGGIGLAVSVITALFVIDDQTFAGIAVAILFGALSFILWGLGSMVDAINVNTLHRDNNNKKPKK